MHRYDLAVLGGGINGAGIAADAAGRGLRVALFEQYDLGGATSSASTKLVHGGLRYLETYDFALVRKALKESQRLLELAPHLVEPIDIYLPHQQHLRPWLLIRAGLFLYNHLARRPSYPRAGAVRFSSDSPLQPELVRGFRFADGQVDDARLVVLNACQARRHGADIFVRHRCVSLRPTDDCWELGVEDLQDGGNRLFLASAVVNAGGPWVSSLFAGCTGSAPRRQVKLVKGSHIVIPRAYPARQAYMLQNPDGRIVFVIPYLDAFTLIGTTEEDYAGDPAHACISEAERDYLVTAYNHYFRRQITPADIVSDWSGVRPLIDDRENTATRTSRDYQLLFEDTPVPLLSVYGGKLTTYRVLAAQAVNRLGQRFPGLPGSRTADEVLPGGDFTSRQQLAHDLQSEFPWLPAELVRRWVGSYGTLAQEFLAGTRALVDLGTRFGHGLTQREVDYLIEREWARSADDILLRRTRLGLLFSAEDRATLASYVERRVADLQ